MHAVTGNKTEPVTYRNALELERTGALKDAAAMYKTLHKHAPKNVKILNRLMIIYRKLKDAVQETRYIDAAIKIREQYYSTRKQADKKTMAISKQLNILLGHTDKKGNAIFKPPELIKLEMRKKRLQHSLVKKPAL